MFEHDRNFDRETRTDLRWSEELSGHVEGTENCTAVVSYVIDDEPVFYGRIGGDWEDGVGFFLDGREVHVPSRQHKFPAFKDFEDKKDNIEDRAKEVRDRKVDTFSLD